ncbi:hypothetical protein ACFY1U_48025 [Streptomyces sp. NPDC001351]|uniref:hypothetical protein n=1 Tax=Streptomyces sp. NPDC001351 TaxID=3364564 RepID=UPI00368BB243
MAEFHIGSTSGGSHQVADQASAINAFIVGATLSPFLQAVAVHFGTRLAGAIDDTTRLTLRIFLRRRLNSSSTASDDAPSPVWMTSRLGWQVRVHADLPAEAIGQLQDMDQTSGPQLSDSPTPSLIWDEKWLLSGADPQGATLHSWDAVSKTWVSLTAAPPGRT